MFLYERVCETDTSKRRLQIQYYIKMVKTDTVKQNLKLKNLISFCYTQYLAPDRFQMHKIKRSSSEQETNTSQTRCLHSKFC